MSELVTAKLYRLIYVLKFSEDLRLPPLQSAQLCLKLNLLLGFLVFYIIFESFPNVEQFTRRVEKPHIESKESTGDDGGEEKKEKEKQEECLLKSGLIYTRGWLWIFCLNVL